MKSCYVIFFLFCIILTDCLEQTIRVKDPKNNSIRFNLQALKGEHKQKQESKSKSKSGSEKIFKKALKGGIAGGGIAGDINEASKAAMSVAGFTTKGVASGSFASAVQSGIGNVGAGSCFAMFQSMGAMGLGILGPYAVPLIAGAAVIGIVNAVYQQASKNQTEQQLTKSQQKSNKPQQKPTKPQYQYQTCFKNTSNGPFFCGPIPQMPDEEITESGSEVIVGLAAGAVGSMIATAVGTAVGTAGTVGSVTGIVGALGAGILGTFALPAVIGAAVLGGAVFAADKLLND